MRRLYFACLVFLTLSACTKESDPPAATARAGNANRGRGIYLSNCAACHSTDPSKEGSTGPAVKGSSRELLEARILRAAYPVGYAPKRKSTAMPTYPYLKSAIPDLAAFLG